MRLRLRVQQTRTELIFVPRNKRSDGTLPLNLILYGPPGTGKTRKILEEYVPLFTDGSKRRYEIVTFHPSYSYEEFVEGLRPVILQREKQDSSHTSDNVPTGEAHATIRETVDVVHYEDVPGVFRRICKRAARDPDSRYALFIDEINRGNVPALFGELITLIEEDKRGKEVTLAYSAPRQRSLSSATSEIDEEHRFSVPPNLHIIGTMNTADRSIALLDVALRRRFKFEEISIDYDALRNALGQAHELHEQRIDVVEILKRMNERICFLYDRDHQIGHGWLTNIKSIDDLNQKFYYNIIPLLTQYFYDDWTKVCLILGEHPEQARQNDLIKRESFPLKISLAEAKIRSRRQMGL